MLFFYFKKVISVFRLIYLKVYLTKVEKISFKIYNTDFSEIKFLPIDRFALEPYLNKILEQDYIEFIVFNFKWFSENYTHRLMVCLPEVFKEITYQDLIKIVNKINDPLPIVYFLNFIQRFLNVDYLKILNSSNVNNFIRQIVLENINKNGKIQPVDENSTYITKDKVGINLSDFYSALKLLKETTPAGATATN